MLTSNQLRQKYFDFFSSKGHVVIPSASLIPENDPTALFIMAGMHPLVPFLMGEKHPSGTRLVNVQKCIRTGDIDEVGDQSHVTFFEMLGNWSLGDYFKSEAIEWSWEFLTSPQWLGLDKKKLAVTVFGGDERYPDLPIDEESVKYWQKIGVPNDKIAKMKGGVVERENNWWGPAGQTGPCGPSTEMFYWVGDSEYPPKSSNPGTDEENWLEIWNDVLMEYNKEVDGSFKPLEKKNIDTGMGLDRTLKVINGLADVYQIDTLWPLIQGLEAISAKEYIESSETIKAMRIICDHIRAATMIIGDQMGVAPSNMDQGYIVRRLIRRAVRQGHVLGINENFCSKIAIKTIEIFEDVYPEIKNNEKFILNEIAKEESKFRNTLENGIKNFELKIKNLDGKTIPANIAFDLYQSYGFPIEMTAELAQEKGLEVDIDGFDKEMKKHQELSRQGAGDKFKGGLADESEMSKKYHTATHLLQAALRKVLGEHVQQKGSNINAQRLRFDFSHGEKLTDEQKEEIEKLVNMAIKKDYLVSFQEMTVSEAKESGAIGLFEDRYENKVKVYTVGDPKHSPYVDKNSFTFSKEICGGPHVKHVGELGKFRIKKEKASSSGVRRIKAVLE